MGEDGDRDGGAELPCDVWQSCHHRGCAERAAQRRVAVARQSLTARAPRAGDHGVWRPHTAGTTGPVE
eukprot:9945975-Lingulodinium_polyedra.AAC.1